jgi:hypothetical protein
VYSWRIGQVWEEQHYLDIVVAQIEHDGSVRTTTERLSLWPYRYEELVAELQRVGLQVVDSDFAVDAENYKVIARLTQGEPASTGE